MSTVFFTAYRWAAALLLALLLHAGPAAALIIDRVVAEVNGEVITLSQLNRELTMVEAQLLRQVAPAERSAALEEARRQVLSGMIDRLLVEQQAARMGIRVDDREVEAAIAQILADNAITLDELRQDLELHHSDLASYRRELQAQILQSRLLSLEVRERVVIPESRIREYYQQHYANQAAEAEEAYHILQIGLTWPAGDQAARDRARHRGEEVREKALAGADFRELARRHSDLPSARVGGDLGVFRRDELGGIMLEQIPELQPGEISALLETAAGYQLFKLLSNRGDVRKQLSYEEAKEEIRALLYEKALEEQFHRWVQNLRQDAYIRIML